MTNPQSLSNFVAGTLSAGISAGATSFSSAGLAALAAISSPYEARVVFDPEATAGAPEIAYVTAHTASATSATISRGKDGTTGRSHNAGVEWRHAVVASTFDAPRGELISVVATDLQTITATSYTDWVGMVGTAVVGSRPIMIDVDVPGALHSAGSSVSLELYDGTAGSALTEGVFLAAANSLAGRIKYSFRQAPAAGSRGYRLRYKVSAGTGYLVWSTNPQALLSIREI